MAVLVLCISYWRSPAPLTFDRLGMDHQGKANATEWSIPGVMSSILPNATKRNGGTRQRGLASFA